MHSKLSEDPLNSTNAAFASEEDLNFDAADLHILDLESNARNDYSSDLDVFHDCQSSLTLPNNEDLDHGHVQECPTIFDVSAISSPPKAASLGET